MLLKYFPILLFALLPFQIFGQIKIVVLGSSTAAGTGASHADSSWVNRYRNYLQNQNPDNEVINLAHGGYTTFHILPTGTSPPANRPNPDISKNITAALNNNPDAIIINLPSNDAASGFSINEQLSNYDAVLAIANDAGVPIWVATTQGRNLDFFERQNLIEMRDSTFSIFGDKAIDFWTYIGQSNGTLNIIYDSGDGVHLNDKGHKILFDRVVEKGIPNVLVSGVNILPGKPPGIKIYPNPSHDLITITFNNVIKKKTELQIIDMTGRVLSKRIIDKNDLYLQLNIADLKSSMYHLIILNNKNVLKKTFIINR